MTDIVITEFMDDAVVAELAAEFDVHYDPDLAATPAQIRDLVADARAIIVRNRTSVDRRLLDAAPHLMAVGRLGVGLDNIDLTACADRGIGVFPAIGANAESVAEYVIAALFVLWRPALAATSAVLAGTWPRERSVGSELGGRRLGLIGLGDIARRVAGKAAALGMDVLAHDPLLPADDPAWEVADRHDLPELLATADAVSIHVPLTSDTANLIDGAALDSMKPTALLVNTSRGGIVDETALAAALRGGRLGGAALDVFAEEPVTAAAGATWADVPNLIATPHIAGLTAESQSRVAAVTAAAVGRALRDSA